VHGRRRALKDDPPNAENKEPISDKPIDSPKKPLVAPPPNSDKPDTAEPEKKAPLKMDKPGPVEPEKKASPKAPSGDKQEPAAEPEKSATTKHKPMNEDATSAPQKADNSDMPVAQISR
jgi:hypothetical protein